MLIQERDGISNVGSDRTGVEGGGGPPDCLCCPVQPITLGFARESSSCGARKKDLCRSELGDPTTNGGWNKMEAQIEICTRRIHWFFFCACFGCAQSVLTDKISASELSQQFIKSALLVGDAFIWRGK